MASNTYSTRTERPGAYFLFALALTLLWLAFIWHSTSHSTPPTPPQKAAPKASQTVRHARAYPVYPYSVVPGGVHSRSDLQRVLAQDAVVAAHYSDFRARDVRTIALSADKLAYVSFRVRNEIYWTKKRILLPKGEQVITDGEHYARTRCGNRISDVPHSRTMPNQPPESLLDLSAAELSFFQKQVQLDVEVGGPGVSPEGSVPLTPVSLAISGQLPNWPEEAVSSQTQSHGGGGLIAPSSPTDQSQPARAISSVIPPTPVGAPAIDAPAPQPALVTGSYIPLDIVPAPTQISAMLYTPGLGQITIPGYLPRYLSPISQQPTAIPAASSIRATQTTPSPAAIEISPRFSGIAVTPAITIPATEFVDITPPSGTTRSDIPQPAPGTLVPTPEPGTLLLLGSSLLALLIFKSRLAVMIGFSIS